MKSAEDLRENILAIENIIPHDLLRGNGAFELIPSNYLLTNLSGNCGALFIRAIMQKLDVNEHQVLKYRLENKFRQYQVLSHYFPQCMPKTRGFSELLAKPDGEQKIRELLNKGYFLKATLGASSFANKNWDRTNEFEEILKSHRYEQNTYDAYMLQKKLRIKHEFRIHTFCNSIIPALSYRIPSTKNTNFHLTAENFVSKVLRKLPNGLLHGTLIGWDIALTEDNIYYVIEANFTGFHPEYLAGFQTTGYVDDPRYGPIICAWLNLYFEKIFTIWIDSLENSLFENFPFYRAFIFYQSIFKNAQIDLIEFYKKKSQNSIIMYLGDQDNILMINLIRQFLFVDFASRYHVIIRDECFTKVNELFTNNKTVQIFKESDFFDQGQLLLIRQLGYDKRKQVCCDHAFRRINDESCVIIS